MRRARILAALVALLVASASLSGCYVLDELDKGQAELDRYSSANNKKKAAAAKAQADGGAGSAEADGKPAGASWWSHARSLNTAPGAEQAKADDPDAVVRCELGGSTGFMRRGDCLSQGGRPR